MKQRKRFAALLVVGAMLFSSLPANALGAERQNTGNLCEHHPAHTAECGYAEETEGTPCNHQHTDECYTFVTNCVHEHTEDCYPAEGVSDSTATPSEPDKAEPTECTHVCSEESGCITKALNCQHEHNSECGYTPASEGTPCTYVCELCNAQDSGEFTQPECVCKTFCTAEERNEDCPVCGAEGADLTLCEGSELTQMGVMTESVNLLAEVTAPGGQIFENTGADEIISFFDGSELTQMGVMAESVNLLAEVTAPGGQISADTGADEIISFFGGSENASVSGKTITLTEGAVIALAKRIEFYSGEWMLNLNDATLKGSGSIDASNVISVANPNTKLTISGDGTVLGGDNTGLNGVGITNGATLCVEAGVTLTVRGGSSNYVAGDAISVHFNSKLENNGTIIATGGDASSYMSGNGFQVEGMVTGSGSIIAKGGNSPSSVGHGILANIATHDVSVSCGSITATGGDCTSAGSDRGHGIYMTGSSNKITLSADTLNATGGNNTNGGTGGAGIHSENAAAEIATQTLTAKGGESGGATLSGTFARLPDGWYTVTFDTDNGSPKPDKQYEYVVRPADPKKEGYTFLDWYNDEKKWDFTSDTVSSDLTLVAKYEKVKEPIPYISYSWDENAQKLVRDDTKTIEAYTLLTADNADIKWTSGWYVVDGNVTINERVITNGDVHLILKDNCQLTTTKGIEVEDSVDGTTTSKLFIYGQSESEIMGKLIANSDADDAAIGSGGFHSQYKCGTITINGGHVEAYPGACAAGIGGGGNTASGGYITINGGKVIATAIGSDGEPAAIGGGGRNRFRGGSVDAIVINGGVISAMGCNKGIGNGAGESDGSITINGGTITANGIGTGKYNEKMTTAIHGGSVICVSGSVNKENQSNWTGIVIEGKSGEVYAANSDKTFTVDTSFEISNDYTLNIPDGITWTIPDGVTITNNGTIVIKNGGAINGIKNIINNGTIRGLPAPTPTVTIAGTTASSITVTELENQDTYGDAEYSLDGINWQTSNVLENLHSNTTYTVYARYKASIDYAESDAGKAENVSTNTANYTITIPAEPVEAGNSESKAELKPSDSFDLGFGGTATVKVKKDSGVDNDGKLTLTRQDDTEKHTITSALLVNNTALGNINNNVATFTLDDKTPVAVSFAKPIETNIPAGTYNGTMTFEVAYSEQ